MFDFLDQWMSLGIWVSIVLIIVGFVSLVKGADWLVDGASALAKRLHVSDMIVGLTVVAFGTSMPEMVVNIISVAHGTTDLAITNIVGSNCINVFVILGATALLCPIAASRSNMRVDIPLSTLAGLCVLVIGAFRGSIVGLSGVFMLAVFGFFMYHTIHEALLHPEQDTETQPMKAGLAIVLILVGLIGLVVGGEMIVKGAVDIAHRMQVGEAIIGLTIVALGTSLPELATSLVAAHRGNTDLALGNAIGSNIFNVFLVLGCSAVISPLPVYDGFVLDSTMAAASGALVWLAVQTDKEHKLRWWHGMLLLLIYTGYLTYRLLSV